MSQTTPVPILQREILDGLRNYKSEFSVEELKLIIRTKCFYDIEFFAQFITTRWTEDKQSGIKYGTPPFHKQLWALANARKDVVCIVPRGFAKTTAVSKIWVLWALLFEQEQSIMLIMSKGLGEEVVGDIRRELETNPLIRLLWGDVVPISNKDEKVNEKWRQRQLQLLNGTELKTVTKGEAIRGNRPTKIIIDDPQENKDVKNPILADEFYHWVFTSVYASLNADGGSMVVLGTLIAENCFVNQLRVEADEKGFEVVEFPAIQAFKDYGFDGVLLWADRWPKEKLMNLCQKLGQKRFEQEFLNVPMILNGSPVYEEDTMMHVYPIKPIFKKHGIDFYVPTIRDKIAFIGVDIAGGGIDGDFSVVIGRDKDFNLLFQYRDKCKPEYLANTIVDFLMTECQQAFVVPERNNVGYAFITIASEKRWAPFIYQTKEVDAVTKSWTNKYGWNTTAAMKQVLIVSHREAIDSKERWNTSEVLRTEMTKFYHDTSASGMNAISPYHDDTIIADALSVQAVKYGMQYLRMPREVTKKTAIQEFEDRLFKKKVTTNE